MATTFLVVVLATAAATFRMTPIYEGVTRVEVQPTSSGGSDSTRLLESLVDPSRALSTQVELIQSESVLKIAAKKLGLPATKPLAAALKVQQVGETQLVQIAVDHERPDEARDWANAMAESYIEFRRERALQSSQAASEAIGRHIAKVNQQLSDLDAKAGPGGPPASAADRTRLTSELTALEAQLVTLPDAQEVQRGGGTIVTAAETPRAPVRPKKKLNVLLGAIIGAMLAAGLAFLAEALDDRIKSPEEVEERVGAPILGHVPFVPRWSKAATPTLAIRDEATSGAAEAYRTLRTNLKFVRLGRPIKSLLVTSAVAGVGKSTTAANLAAVLAQGGTKVVLVSADLRRPSVHKFFGLTNSHGILEALDPDFALEETLQTSDVPNLKFLLAGGLPPNPTEILASPRFAQILAKLEEISDIVVIDSPPVLGLADSSALAAKVDGILHVLDITKATRREVSHATDQLRKAGGKIIGCVLNAVESGQDYGYYYHYYYSQYEEEPSKERLTGMA